MFTAFAKFFAALTVLFGAFSRAATAVDHLAESAEIHARKYRDETLASLDEEDARILEHKP